MNNFGSSSLRLPGLYEDQQKKKPSSPEKQGEQMWTTDMYVNADMNS